MALQALQQQTFRNWNGAVVEIDILKYFNRIPHGMLMGLLRKKISDRRFLRLIEVLKTAPVLEEGQCCPQGSMLSPILANIYLHHVIDEWFAEISRSRIRGKVDMVRYADDMVFTFEYQHEAKRFLQRVAEKTGSVAEGVDTPLQAEWLAESEGDASCLLICQRILGWKDGNNASMTVSETKYCTNSFSKNCQLCYRLSMTN